VLLGSFGLFAQALVDPCQVVVRSGTAGVELDGALELAGGAREIAPAFEQDAELVVRFLEIALQCDRLVQQSLYLTVVARFD